MRRALRPAALVSAGRLRVVAALDFLPEIGVYKVEGQPAELHWAMRLPVGAIVTRRVGIELELGAGPTLGYTGSVGVMLR